MRPQLRPLRMLQHSAPFLYLSYRPRPQIRFPGFGFGKMPQIAPAPARWVGDYRTATRPKPGISIRIPRVYSWHRFVDTVSADE